MMKIKSSQKLWEDSKEGPWKFDSVSCFVDCLDKYSYGFAYKADEKKTTLLINVVVRSTVL